MASLTSGGLNLESGTTTLRSILGSNVLITTKLDPTSDLGKETTTSMDNYLPALSPGQCAKKTYSIPSVLQMAFLYLPSGGTYVYNASGGNSAPAISPSTNPTPGGTQIGTINNMGPLSVTYCRAY